GEIIDNFFNKDIETLKELLNYTSLNNNETRRFLYDCIISLLTKENQQNVSLDFLIDKYSDLIANDIYTE
ncbi:hypothetical protein, partial [Flavobacterium psychrophilum]